MHSHYPADVGTLLLEIKLLPWDFSSLNISSTCLDWYSPTDSD